MGVKEAVQGNSWVLFPAFILSLGLLVALYVKRKETPINLILLAAFTVVEAYTVGVLVTFFDQGVVIQAFFLTAAVVIGLTAFTFQTKRDFSNLGAVLYTGLLVLILGGFLNIFIGSELTETAMAVGGALLFSLFIIFDTQLIMTRLSPEEYRGHHPALPRHYQPLHRDPQDSGEGQQEIVIPGDKYGAFIPHFIL